MQFSIKAKSDIPTVAHHLSTMADSEKQNIDGPRFDAQKPLLSGVKGYV